MRMITDVVGDIILAKAHDVLAKVIKPDITIGKVTDIDENGIEWLKHEYDIEGIILDVDETLRIDGRSIPPANQDWIERIKDNFKVIVISNGMDKKLEEYFKEKGITYIPFAFKPLKMNFKKACEEMAIDPEKILVVGDSLVDDILGAKRNNFKSALVQGVEEAER